MAKIIKFPVPPEFETRQFSRKIDEEISEIHARVDREIEEKYGSLEGYGKFLIQKSMQIQGSAS